MKNLNECTNEALYAGLTEGTLPEEALTTLRDRLYPIIMNEAKPYFEKLGWERDDALQEALILIWETVAKRSFDANVGRGLYHHFFSAAWKNRMINIYRKAIRQPVILGQALLGYSSTGEPVYGERYGFDPKREEYLKRHREECKRSVAKKRAAEGKPAPQPVKRLADLTEEELEARRLVRNARALANYHAKREEKLAAQRPTGKRTGRSSTASSANGTRRREPQSSLLRHSRRFEPRGSESAKHRSRPGRALFLCIHWRENSGA